LAQGPEPLSGEEKGEGGAESPKTSEKSAAATEEGL